MLSQLLEAAASASAAVLDPHSPFEVTARNIGAIAIIIVVGSVANSAGVGGGAIFIPVLQALVGFGLKDATALSQALITSGSIISVAINLFKRSPLDPNVPLINFSVALSITPVVLAGVAVGVLLNTILPVSVITLLLLLFMLVMVFQTTAKGTKMWRSESARAKAVAQIKAAAAAAAAAALPATSSAATWVQQLPAAANESWNSLEGGGAAPAPDLPQVPAIRAPPPVTRTDSDHSHRVWESYASLEGVPVPVTIGTRTVAAAQSVEAVAAWFSSWTKPSPHGGGWAAWLGGGRAADAGLREPLLGAVEEAVDEEAGLPARSLQTQQNTAPQRSLPPPPALRSYTLPRISEYSTIHADAPRRVRVPQQDGADPSWVSRRSKWRDRLHSVGDGTLSAELGGGTEQLPGLFSRAASLRSDSTAIAVAIASGGPVPLLRSGSHRRPPSRKEELLKGPPVIKRMPPVQGPLPPDVAADILARLDSPRVPSGSGSQSASPVAPAAAPGAAAGSASPVSQAPGGATLPAVPSSGEFDRHTLVDASTVKGKLTLLWYFVTDVLEVIVSDLLLVPWPTVLILLGTWAVFSTIQIKRSRVAKCSSAYWSLLVGQLAFMLTVSLATLIVPKWFQRAKAGQRAPSLSRTSSISVGSASPSSSGQDATTTVAVVVDAASKPPHPHSLSEPLLAAPVGGAGAEDGPSPSDVVPTSTPVAADTPHTDEPVWQTDLFGESVGASLGALSIGFLAGAIGGTLGLGGGMLLSPLLLELGFHPQVTAATSSLTVIFSSSGALLGFVMLGRLNVQYGLVFGSAAAAASFLGVSVVSDLVKRSGRLSLVVFALAAIMVSSLLIIAAFGLFNIVADFESGSAFALGSLCT